MHADQLTVGIKTVRELISNQFPEWTGLPITEVTSQGTVNALFRIGDQLAARFPLLPAGVDETRRWLECCGFKCTAGTEWVATRSALSYLAGVRPSWPTGACI